MYKYGLLVVLLLNLIRTLTACGGQAVEKAAPPEEEAAPAEEEVAGKPVIPECGAEEVGKLPDLGGREIVIAIEGTYPPFNSTDPLTGEGIGWDYDVGREICERLNCVPIFTEVAWDGIFPAMSAGEYDILFDGITYTAERDEVVDFSCAYVNAGHVLLARIDEDRFTTPEEFKADKNLTVATQLGSNSEMVATEFVGTDRIRSFEDFPTAIQALLSSDVDGAVTDTVAAIGLSEANPGKLKIIQPPVTSDEQLALVFPPNSDLIAPFNAALHAIAADGTLETLNDKWTNP